MRHVIEAVSPAKFAQVVEVLKSRTGIVLAQAEGTVEKRGFAVHYRYDAAAQTLLLEQVKKPWFVPQSLIDSRIKDFLGKDGRALLEAGTGERREVQ